MEIRLGTLRSTTSTRPDLAGGAATSSADDVGPGAAMDVPTSTTSDDLDPLPGTKWSSGTREPARSVVATPGRNGGLRLGSEIQLMIGSEANEGRSTPVSDFGTVSCRGCFARRRLDRQRLFCRPPRGPGISVHHLTFGTWSERGSIVPCRGGPFDPTVLPRGRWTTSSRCRRVAAAVGWITSGRFASNAMPRSRRRRPVNEPPSVAPNPSTARRGSSRLIAETASSRFSNVVR